MNKDYNDIGSIDDILSEFLGFEEVSVTDLTNDAATQNTASAPEDTASGDAFLENTIPARNSRSVQDEDLYSIFSIEDRQERTKNTRSGERESAVSASPVTAAKGDEGRSQIKPKYSEDSEAKAGKIAKAYGRQGARSENEDKHPSRREKSQLQHSSHERRIIPAPTAAKSAEHNARDESVAHKVGNGFFALVFFAAMMLVILWSLFNIHPASSTLSTASGSGVLKLSDKLDVYVNNAASDALGELAYIKKIYTIPETDTISPVPNPANFGQTNDPAEIQELISKAEILLDGQSVIFDPSAEFVPGEPIRYYLDDTILVIAWKEYINQRCCTCAEVKIAHASQLRRKIAEDSYSSSVQLYASDMANQANSVIAINGDFYVFRDLGITAYQRTLYRNSPEKVDSCFFTASGDMLFSRAGELKGEGEAARFIEENDVLFAIAFGPVLIDDGELQYCNAYPIGEINTEYSRSCIGMTEPLHYFLMTINHTPDSRPRATVNELARFVYSKGVQKAYNLDGGQTSEIIMNGGPINHVDFGNERAISDIIYFATAIPNEEAAR